MAVGNTADAPGLNRRLGDAAVAIRDATAEAEKLWGYVVSLGADQAAQTAGLVAAGFSSPDAATFWTEANRAFAVYQLYHGNIAQPSPFNYHDSLAGPRGAS
jgi:hypothetical protein